MEIPTYEAILKAQALPENAELPPKKRLVNIGKEVSNEPLEITNLERNSTPTVLEQTRNIDPQNQQKPRLDQESQKPDPQPKVIKKDESEPSFTEYSKKRPLDKGKEVYIEQLEVMYLRTNPTSTVLEQAQNVDSQNQQKIYLDQEPQKADPKPEVIVLDDNDDSEPSFNEYLKSNEDKKEESSDLTRRPIECRFCGQKFPSTQALGGHQNAHKKERDLQKAMKVANEFGNNPFMYSLPGTLSPAFRGTPSGRPFQYHPYDRYNHTSAQERPVYSHPGTGLPQGGPSGFGREAERFIGPSSVRPVGTAVDPRWPITYPTSLGPIRRSNGPTNYNPHAGSNWMAFTQARENEASVAKKQQVESLGLGLSLMRREPARMSLFPERGESSNLESPLQAKARNVIGKAHLMI